MLYFKNLPPPSTENNILKRNPDKLAYYKLLCIISKQNSTFRCMNYVKIQPQLRHNRTQTLASDFQTLVSNSNYICWCVPYCRFKVEQRSWWMKFRNQISQECFITMQNKNCKLKLAHLNCLALKVEYKLSKNISTQTIHSDLFNFQINQHTTCLTNYQRLSFFHYQYER